MDIQSDSIVKKRNYLKGLLLNLEKAPKGFKNERTELISLLQRTIKFGESNSILLIGPRSVGKTMLVNDVLRELLQSVDFKENGLLVRLHGLIHTDDRLALKGITSQMNLENAVDGRVFGSFADNLSFLLACLRSGDKETAKSIIFVLDEFDLFCAHHNQTLLYNLFDVSQSAQTPICVLGVTRRLDVVELFEKRVKSRFSHRQIFLFPGEPDLEEKLTDIETFLTLSATSDFPKNHIVQWNKDVKQLVNNKKFSMVIQRLLDLGSFDSVFKNIMLLAISNLNDSRSKLTPEDFELQLRILEKDDMIRALHDLSSVELCLIIAMKHHREIYEEQPFNFEMILTRYHKFATLHSNMQAMPRHVVIKAFEHLQFMELIMPTSGVNKLQKEYQSFKLLVTSTQISEAIKSSQGLPAEIKQWANSSII